MNHRIRMIGNRWYVRVYHGTGCNIDQHAYDLGPYTFDEAKAAGEQTGHPDGDKGNVGVGAI